MSAGIFVAVASPATTSTGSGEAGILLTVVFCIWMLLVLYLGFYASRFTRSTEGFFLGDRKMGSWVTSISSTASSESGWLLLGAVGEAYMWGAQAAWIAVGCLLGYAFNWFFFAEKLRKKSKKQGSITVPEYLEYHLNDKSHLIRIIGVVIIIFLMFTYVAAQMNAAGKSLNTIFGMDYRLGVLIGGALTVIYTMMGGYRAVSWTDLVQGLLMVTALVVMPIVSIIYIGGPHKLAQKLADSPGGKVMVFEIQTGDKQKKEIRVEERPLYIHLEKGVIPAGDAENSSWHVKIQRVKEDEKQVFKVYFSGIEDKIIHNKEKKAPQTLHISKGDRLKIGDKLQINAVRAFSLTGGKDLLSGWGGRTGLGLMGFVIGMLGIGLGYPGMPHVVTRYMSAQDSEKIRRGRLIAMTWGVLSMYGAVFMGMIARVLLPGILDPETAILKSSMLLLHPALSGVILAAVISAILSTADSQLLVAASAVCRDLYQKFISTSEIKEKTMVKISRVTVVVLGILAILLALTESRIVFWFVLFSWAGLGASFGPVLILSVFWKKLTRQGVIAGMLTGLITTILWKVKLKALIAEVTNLELYELVPAFFLALAVAIVVSLLTGDEEKPETEGKDLVESGD